MLAFRIMRHGWPIEELRLFDIFFTEVINQTILVIYLFTKGQKIKVLRPDSKLWFGTSFDSSPKHTADKTPKN